MKTKLGTDGKTYILFWGDADIYSNFYLTPVHSPAINRVLPSSEHVFMLYKALYFGDNEIAEKICRVNEPYSAKKLGRQISRFDESVWDSVSYSYMFAAVESKFLGNPHLKEQLISSGESVLVEASPFDKKWGIGYDCDHEYATSPEKWKGENRLGNVLMDLRKTLQGE